MDSDSDAHSAPTATTLIDPQTPQANIQIRNMGGSPKEQTLTDCCHRSFPSIYLSIHCVSYWIGWDGMGWDGMAQNDSDSDSNSECHSLLS